MVSSKILYGKSILVVDDEPDILESVEDVLSMCMVETATDYKMARDRLNAVKYDVAVLDIMGVNGYDLLDIANENGIPAVMLTAHALSADNFAKSMDKGAHAYLPKDKLHEIDVFIADVLEDLNKKAGILGKWFSRLKGYYENKFGPGWLDEYKGAWH
jgi:DNA-binding NtrC family response regulator